jgi:hypothetical protein
MWRKANAAALKALRQALGRVRASCDAIAREAKRSPFSALLFLATAAYTVFAALQWRAMQNQLEEMRASSAQTDQTIAALNRQADVLGVGLRAWVAPVNLALQSEPDVAHTSARLHMVNTGRTPALNVTWSNIKVVLLPHIDATNVSGAVGAIVPRDNQGEKARQSG